MRQRLEQCERGAHHAQQHTSGRGIEGVGCFEDHCKSCVMMIQRHFKTFSVGLVGVTPCVTDCQLQLNAAAKCAAGHVHVDLPLFVAVSMMIAPCCEATSTVEEEGVRHVDVLLIRRESNALRTLNVSAVPDAPKAEKNNEARIRKVLRGIERHVEELGQWNPGPWSIVERMNICAQVKRRYCRTSTKMACVRRTVHC